MPLRPRLRVALAVAEMATVLGALTMGSLPIPAPTPLAATRVAAAQRLDVLVRGTDNSVRHISTDGTTWSAWDNQGGVVTSAPSSVSWGSNRVDVFVRGTDNGLLHKWWDGSAWSAWQQLGG